MTPDLQPPTSDFLSILDMGSERVVADLAVKTLEENPDSIRDMLDLCFLEKYPLSMRAARAVQLYCEKHPAAIYPFLDEAVEKTIQSEIKGVRHNFLKIFAEFIEINKISDPGPLLNTCFEWLLNRNITPAIKIHSMGVIFKLGLKEPTLLQELAATIEIIMDESEISLKTCGRKMLKRISRQLAVGS
ncbi:MAG: hypothetical protein HGA23_04525 [Bacteroidales bacterium]|nr:hypothetical protein [Bacteroidales bacterium]